MQALQIVLVTVILFSSVSKAGISEWNERGNGGDILLCSRNNGAEVYFHFYDVYEADVRYGLKAQIPAVNETLSQDEQRVVIFESFLNRIAQKDPQRAQQYKTWMATFFAESQFVKGSHLGDIPDTGIGIIPAACQLKQLIAQNPDPFLPYEARYFIDPKFWQVLSVQDQAAALLHELVYRGALEKNPALRSSEKVRLFVALVLSDKLQDLNAEEYQRKITVWGL